MWVSLNKARFHKRKIMDFRGRNSHEIFKSATPKTRAGCYHGFGVLA
jgi:hypothetical protein